MGSRKGNGKRVRDELNTTTSSVNIDWMDKLPEPIKRTLKILKDAMNHNNQDKTWPKEIKIIAARSNLRKLPAAREYLETEFQQAWECYQSWKQTKPEKGIIYISELNEIYERNCADITKSDGRDALEERFLVGTMIQRWNEGPFPEKPKTPIALLLRQGNNSRSVIVVKCFPTTDKKGNYKVLKELPFGATITVAGFKFLKKNAMYPDSAFNNNVYNFDVNVTDATIKFYVAGSSSGMTTVEINELGFLRKLTRIQAVFLVCTDKDCVKSVGDPVSQWVQKKEAWVDRWSINVYDNNGYTAILSIWDANALVERIRNHSSEGELKLKVALPSSYKEYNGDIILNLDKNSILEIL